MSAYFDDEQRAVVAAAVDRLIPPLGDHPGGVALGVVDYISTTLGAFAFDPPRIFAGGPFSGRAGGEPAFAEFTPLTRHQERAWRTRIDEWQEAYRDGLAALGPDFATCTPEEQDIRLDAVRAFKALLYEHACEGAYGAPEYGGNRELAGWQAIGFPGDSQPRGYTDEEVSGPD
ncbi:MAG: gluconate 2-dehydrogenase subunit 3 family protein [Acidimicrobiia bacterium]